MGSEETGNAVTGVIGTGRVIAGAGIQENLPPVIRHAGGPRVDDPRHTVDNLTVFFLPCELPTTNGLLNFRLAKVSDANNPMQLSSARTALILSLNAGPIDETALRRQTNRTPGRGD